MKRLFRASLIFSFLLLGTNTVSACSCVADSLGKRFKKAKAVFIGKAANPEPNDRSLIQNNASDNDRSQLLEIVKGFKGTKKQFINVTFDVESLEDGGMCPTLYNFDENQEYLVFAYGGNFEVHTVCSDTLIIPSDKESLSYEFMQSHVEKLDSFWFRLRARLNPF